jgi:hypothetical protein
VKPVRRLVTIDDANPREESLMAFIMMGAAKP